jgi:catechol-2,3-dioxygenase
MTITDSITSSTSSPAEAPVNVRGVNHVALRVRDVETSAAFYGRVLGFTEEVDRFGNGVLAFLRAPLSTNHHDIALLGVGAKASDAAGPHSVGMFHFALEVADVDDLLSARDRLAAEDALDGVADHGATKAVYGTDPDGNTVEVMWVVPREHWGEWETAAPIKKPMDLEAEVNHWHSIAAGAQSA